MSGIPIRGGTSGPAGGSVIQGVFLNHPAIPVRSGIQPKSDRRIAAGQTAFPLNLAPGSLGAPLSGEIQAKMERAFGVSFANVRIHLGPQPAAIGAVVFTHGQDIHFAPGQYAPHTPRGLFLLAHELAHVVQQRSRRVVNPFGAGIAVVQNRHLDSEANVAAQRVAAIVRAQPAPPRFAPVPAGVGRSVTIQRMEEKKSRPSREERSRNRVVFTTLRGSDKFGRTRGGKEAKGKLEQFEKEGWDLDKIVADLGKDAPPVRLKLTGELIFKGSRSFPEKFSNKFWSLQPNPVICSLCGKEITMSDQRTIEHSDPWATLKTEMETTEVCKGGKHWNVVTRAEALRVICDGDPDPESFDDLDDRPNLSPAHKTCNSSKNGPKDTDAITPQPSHTPHTDICTLPQAE